MPQYLKISYLQQNLVPFPKRMIPGCGSVMWNFLKLIISEEEQGNEVIRYGLAGLPPVPVDLTFPSTLPLDLKPSIFSGAKIQLFYRRSWQTK